MKKVNEIKPGQRFFYGMWYTFVKAELVCSCYHVWVTSGYDEHEFLVIVHKDDEVKVSTLTAGNTTVSQ